PELLLVRAEGALERLAGVQPLPLLLRVRLANVEQPKKHQVGHLLNDGQRIGDPAAPEIVPEFIDARLQFAGNHLQILHAYSTAPSPCLGAKAPTTATSSLASGSSKTPSRPSLWIKVKGGSYRSAISMVPYLPR